MRRFSGAPLLLHLRQKFEKWTSYQVSELQGLKVATRNPAADVAEDFLTKCEMEQIRGAKVRFAGGLGTVWGR